ncbi:uncharacterized protein LOC119675562 [Teleopsis dalmanni]|uniref:uncharacterized protein LOC119675562 n=1 Tax=Teleopsis dalmanni TaxID=139649 RepID=UPI0018CEBF7C|nr:uncharacterized protein LOC119675562 [Teleopsis dalmanni]
MKIFVTILLATTVTLSVGDVQPGYNYQQTAFGSNTQQNPLIMQILSGPIPQQAQRISQQSIIPLSLTQPSNQYLPTAQSQYQRFQQAQQSSVGMVLPMPLGFPGVLQAPKTPRRLRPRVKVPKKPIVTKNFFIHAAPEETDDDIEEELAQLAQQPRKHYNVLFVKTPTQTSKAAALNLAKSLKQEKTVVYVLSKKTSATELQDAIAEAPQHVNKPEVFFIKYRTAEEAAHAQRQIQTQYDSLGGSSTITDEGVAPVTSVVGSLDAPEEEEIDEQQLQQLPQEQSSQQQQQITQLDQQSLVNGNSIGNQYLPPSQY